MQAYKQFGNSVTVPLIQAVSKNLVNEILKQNGESRHQFDENLSIIEHKQHQSK